MDNVFYAYNKIILNMRILLYLIFFIIISYLTYKKTIFGLVSLIILCCTFTLFNSIISINFLGGSITIADFIISTIFIKTITKIPMKKNDYIYHLILILIFWLFISGFICTISGFIGIREFYRLIFKISLFWILPITIREFNFATVKKLLIISIISISTIAIIQIYLILFKNIKLLYLLYSSSISELYEFSSNEFYLVNIYKSGSLPRMYISGHIFIKMLFSFILTYLFITNRKRNYSYLYIICLILGIFILLLSGLSDIFYIMITILLSFIVMFKIQKNRKKLYYSFLIFISISVLVIINLNKIINSTYMHHAYERFQQVTLTKSIDQVRLNDTMEGFKILLANPLWGIGLTKVHWIPYNKSYGGQDIHPIISQGLIGGFPAIILLLLIYYYLYTKFLINLKQFNIISISAFIAIFSMFILSLINTSASFLYANSQVPLGIFAGVLLSSKI